MYDVTPNRREPSNRIIDARKTIFQGFFIDCILKNVDEDHGKAMTKLR